MSATRVELKAAAERHALDSAITGTGGSCRHHHTACCGKWLGPWVSLGQVAPSPQATPLRPSSFMAATGPSRPAHKRPAFTGQYYARSLFMGKPLGSGDQPNRKSRKRAHHLVVTRTSRTSATRPTKFVTETRSYMDGCSCCFLFDDFTERRGRFSDQPISRQSLGGNLQCLTKATHGRALLSTVGGTKRPRQMRCGHATGAWRRGFLLCGAANGLRRNRDRVDGHPWRKGGRATDVDIRNPLAVDG